MKHPFILNAVWNGGRNSDGTIEAGQLKAQISIPKEMGGPGVGTNPDEMLLGAAATCYLITLAAMLERSELITSNLTLTSEATVDVTNNIFTYEAIKHSPIITLSKDASQDDIDKAIRIAHKAEGSCMISRAVAGNVQITTEPTVLTASM
ncbi:OsmC family protein [Paenibacillus sp. G2S3]|uniref:OsmC family protein n=1 Tax=Paenibacillus sp. G2S3 TaxID=3047872 RepID=UPI0024C1AA9E|nr:OsmC family protein [Paenibacillus sp. G2S3]WHY16778.1 OsmC family protein [Paenibacillus sp. G2S3]